MLSINSISFASETYAYCVTKNGEWKFLPNGVVQGEWIRNIHNSSVDRSFRTELFYSFYFKPDKGIEELNHLRSRCKVEIGDNYIYVQPADSRLTNWHAFGLSNKNIFPFYKNVMFCNQRP